MATDMSNSGSTGCSPQLKRNSSNDTEYIKIAIRLNTTTHIHIKLTSPAICKILFGFVWIHFLEPLNQSISIDFPAFYPGGFRNEIPFSNELNIVIAVCKF